MLTDLIPDDILTHPGFAYAVLWGFFLMIIVITLLLNINTRLSKIENHFIEKNHQNPIKVKPIRHPKIKKDHTIMDEQVMINE